MYALAAVLLAAAFAPFARAAAVPGDFDVVRVNGVAIRQSEILERLWKRHGSPTLEEMVDELLMRQAAAAKKIKASPAEIDARFARLQSQFGSRELFVSQLDQAGTTVAKVKEDLAEEIVRERLIVEARGIKISDDDLKKAFEANKERLRKPESVHLRQIVVKTEAEAAELTTKIKAGEDFKALARAKSISPSGKATGGDYNYIARGTFPPEIDSVLFSMTPGEVKVVTGPRGAHILQVLDKRPSEPRVFDEVKTDLREHLLAEMLKEAAGPYLVELRRKADIQTPGQPKQPAAKKQ